MITTDYLALTSNVSNSKLTHLRVENGRLRNNAGYEHINGVSDFAAIWYVLTGQTNLLINRLNYYKSCNRRHVRFFCMLDWLNNSGPAPIQFNPLNVGFWQAAQRVVNLCAERGMYSYIDLFADAQQFNSGEREVMVRVFAEFCHNNYNKVLPGLANEARKNGFKEANDPELLGYANLFASLVGHKDFVISDYLDGESEEETDAATEVYIQLARYSNILAMHPSRTRTGDEWRWINHLKTFQEQVERVKDATKNPNIYGFHREPMGAASRDSSNRDSNPYHHIAANFVSNCLGLGYIGHYIPEQDSVFPGLVEMGISRQINADPSFKYINATLAGSAVRSFSGYTKVRPCQNPEEMFACGYGGDGSIVSDYSYNTLYTSPYVKLYHGLI